MATTSEAAMEEEPSVLLRGQFSVFPRKKYRFDVKLTQKALFYRSQSSSNVTEADSFVPLSDVTGCQCQQGKWGDRSAYFTIYAYPFRKKRFSGKQTRQRFTLTFGVEDFDSYEQNRTVSDRWRRVILVLSQGLKVTKRDVDTCVPATCGKLLVLVNPFSGQGKAMQIFSKQVVPMLQEAELPYELVQTEYAGHAKELVASMKLEDYYGVVIVSGDGLVYEVVNGLMSRADWTQAVKTPVGVLPGGSGNALACSVNYYAGEPILENIALHSTFVLIKHKVLPMDLVSLETLGQKVYSFLSTTIGLMADVDYESEKYRHLGGARFTVGAFKRIIGLRTYRIKVSYLPIAEYESKQPNGTTESGRILKKTRKFSLRSKNGSLDALDDVEIADEVVVEETGDKVRSHSVPGPSDEDEDDRVAKHRTKSEAAHGGSERTSEILSEDQLFSGLLHADPGVSRPVQGAGDVIPDPHHRRSQTNDSLNSDDNGVIHENVTALKEGNAPVPTPLMPPLTDPVPSDWVTVEDDFISVAVIYQSHLSNEAMAVPQSRLSDGFVHIMLLRRAGVSRTTLINLFMAMADGSHVDSPHVEIVRALAFRIEPLDKEGSIMVDGELVDFGPIQGHVLPQLGRIMAIQ